MYVGWNGWERAGLCDVCYISVFRDLVVLSSLTLNLPYLLRCIAGTEGFMYTIEQVANSHRALTSWYTTSTNTTLPDCWLGVRKSLSLRLKSARLCYLQASEPDLSATNSIAPSPRLHHPPLLHLWPQFSLFSLAPPFRSPPFASPSKLSTDQPDPATC